MESIDSEPAFIRIGEGSVAEVIDLGEDNDCERYMIVEALVDLQKNGEFATADLEFF
jgi:hypothetical protein